MKVSINLANKYSSVKLDKDGTDQLAKYIGSQLGAIENIETWSEKYQTAIVAKVVECTRHPNADKLSLCKIDDGGVDTELERDQNGLIQVICGASNVRDGVLAVWLPPKSIVPVSYGTKEPFRLESRELRGIVSHGMLASPDELGLPGGHEGILLLEAGQPGQFFADIFGLNDTVFDLENKMFTHRPDCFGVIGVARELAGIQNLAYKSPDWYLREPEFKNTIANPLPLSVEVETDLVPRFMAVAMSDIKVGPSPIEIQAALLVSGIKPVNNIVDITNYLMQITGQPLHAYDYDKLKKCSGDTPTIKARLSETNEIVMLLNGKQTRLENENTVIIATDTQAIGVGGIMGGSSTEVDENSKNIVIECANFEPYNIRRSSMKYGLFTEAVTRFNKGQSTLQNSRILAKAMVMVSELAGGQQASEVFDIKQSSMSSTVSEVKLSVKFINNRLGASLSATQICNLLNNVEFKASERNEQIVIEVPFWRMDIEIPEDIVEEVGRLYGFDKLPVELPTVKLSIAKNSPNQQVNKIVRNSLSAAGANEILTYNFVNGKLLIAADQNPELAHKLGNALSPALGYYRLSILPNLIDKIHPNIKAGYDEFAIFEIGKSHNKQMLDENNLPAEKETVSLVFTANDKKAKNYHGEAYFTTKAYLDFLLNSLGIVARYEPFNNKIERSFDEQTTKPFSVSRSALVVSQNNEVLGIIGEFKKSVIKSFKLPEFVAGFELDLLKLQAEKKSPNYQEQPKYPKVEQDISLKVRDSVNFQTINNLFGELVAQNKPQSSLLNYQLTDIYHANGYKHYSFRVNIASFEKTLSSAEVNKLLDVVANKLNSKIGATRL